LRIALLIDIRLRDAEFFCRDDSSLRVPAQPKDHSVERLVELLLVLARHQALPPLGDQLPVIVLRVKPRDAVAPDPADQALLFPGLGDLLAEIGGHENAILFIQQRVVLADEEQRPVGATRVVLHRSFACLGDCLG